MVVVDTGLCVCVREREREEGGRERETLLQAAIVEVHTVNSSNMGSNGAEESVLLGEVSIVQGLKGMQECYLG